VFSRQATRIELLLFDCAAAAQTGNPAFTPSGTPSAKPTVPAHHQLNTTNRIFIRQLAISNAAEIDLGMLARQKAHGRDRTQGGPESSTEPASMRPISRPRSRTSETITLVMDQIGSGQDRALRSFAADTLPKIREHLQMAQSLALATTPRCRMRRPR